MPHSDNSDLVGKVYKNGEGGSRYRVVEVDKTYPELVRAENLLTGEHCSAMAAFVRHWIVESEPCQ